MNKANNNLKKLVQLKHDDHDHLLKERYKMSNFFDKLSEHFYDELCSTTFNSHIFDGISGVRLSLLG
jgi:hypothetical protein